MPKLRDYKTWNANILKIQQKKKMCKNTTLNYI